MPNLATKNPSGITITRNGNLKFVVAWKCTDSNYSGGQQVRIRAMKDNGKTTAWQEANVSATNKQFTFTESDYNPSKTRTIKYIEAEVRGKCAQQGKTYDWSGYTNKKLTINAPKKPTVTATLNTTNKTTFAWSVETDSKDTHPFIDVQYQSMLVRACDETDGSKLKWKTSAIDQSGTGNATGSKAITESSISNDSYTRWFRIRARGAGGSTDWKYSKHVYAVPYAPKIESVTATVKNNTTICTAKWKAKSTASHPIDQVLVQYTFVKPNSGLACPSNASWTTAATVTDTKGSNSIKFTINGTVPDNQCLFVRVVAQHDSNDRNSSEYLVKKGALSAPTISNVSVDSGENKITVTATHASGTPDDTFIAVWFESKSIRKTAVGIVPHNATGTTPSAVKCPEWGTDDISVGVQEIQGSYTAKNNKNNVKTYAIQANMKSAITWRDGDVPRIPRNVTATAASDAIGEVIITWDWSWADADQAEISWSDNPNAWESTEEPNTYVLDRVYQARRRVVNLETGKTWYFAVRLLHVREDGGITYGDYSEVIPVSLSSAPNVPILALSHGIIAAGDILTATWEYITTDGTSQACAEIYEATISGTTVTVSSRIAETQTAQHIDIDTSIWTSDTYHYLVCRVISESGMESEWSDPIPVYIAQPLTCSVSTASIASTNIPNGAGGTMSVPALAAMPITVTVTGAGAGGMTTVIIERADEYHMLRPDESVRDGYKGETIALIKQIGEAAITINKEDLIGSLDDGAQYKLICTVEDDYGQSDTKETPFFVWWSNRAVIPSATVVIENGVAKITPTSGSGTPQNSTCDIYRLSVEKPQLIVRDGSFGTAYVDPYPALGPNAGYRVVCKTPNGDYINSSSQPAWVDVVNNFINNANGIITFGGESVEVKFNVKLSTSWKKDFKETKYLGGTVRGDWNPAISRTTTVTVSIPTSDTESIQKMRRLSEYNGICHVRTQDGASYTADVQVTNGTGYDSAGKNAEYTLQITRIEPEALDGVPYSEWVVS